MAELNALTVERFMNEYEQIRTPDFAAIASYLNRAKGAERSMAQFAEAAQISASTLSRIVNGRSAKPLSKEAIVKIFESRASSEDEYLLEFLARANGMFPKEYVERVKTRNIYAARRNEEINREHLMKNALIAGVVASGGPVTRVVNTPIYRSDVVPALYPRRRGNFVLELAPSINNPAPCAWSFFLYPMILDELDRERHRTARSVVRDIIDRVSGWFLLDAWGDESMKGDKFSFVFLEENIFNEFVETLQVARLNMEMTAILMDPNDYRVLREVWLPGQYTQMTNISIFELPIPMAYDDYYEDADDRMEDNE